MAYSTRRARHSIDIWPGFVDALANLLLVFIFVLMVFVLAQFFLSQTLSGRDAALALLQGQVSELADLLALERRAKDDLSQNITRLTDELNASIAARDTLGEQVVALTRRAESAEAGLAEGQEAQRQVIKLSNDIAALQALKKELEQQAASLSAKATESDQALAAERELSETARAQVALLNQQMAAIRYQALRIAITLCMLNFLIISGAIFSVYTFFNLFIQVKEDHLSSASPVLLLILYFLPSISL